MNKLKLSMIFVLSFAIIISGMFLPSMVSAFQDGLSKSVYYRHINKVTLDMGEENSFLSYPEKMLLLAEGLFVDIAESEEAKGEDYIRAVTFELLEPYFALELLPHAAESYILEAASSRLGYYYDNPEINVKVWEVTLRHAKEGIYVDLIIDVNTEKILFVDIGFYYGLHDQPEYVEDTFWEIYFSQLGLTSDDYVKSNQNAYIVTTEDSREIILQAMVDANGLRMVLSVQDADTMQK